MPEPLRVQAVGGRAVLARVDGGARTSDGGAVLRRAVERATGVVRRFAGCFTDYRDPARVTHPVGALVRRRVSALALGDEDLHDHDALRHDPLLAVLAAADDLTVPLAGKRTRDRLEWSAATVGGDERSKKITVDPAAVDRLLVELFVEAHAAPPREIVLDLDATDDPVHGAQEGRFVHGYSGHYCYLPLYSFAGEHLLLARLRRADTEASAGRVDELARIVAQLRAAWPAVAIPVRAASGFCREALMQWCEAHGVDYVLGLARNARLTALIVADLVAVETESVAAGIPVRRFAELTSATLDSWSRARRVVAKAEYLPTAGASGEGRARRTRAAS